MTHTINHFEFAICPVIEHMLASSSKKPKRLFVAVNILTNDIHYKVTKGVEKPIRFNNDNPDYHIHIFESLEDAIMKYNNITI